MKKDPVYILQHVYLKATKPPLGPPNVERILTENAVKILVPIQGVDRSELVVKWINDIIHIKIPATNRESWYSYWDKDDDGFLHLHIRKELLRFEIDKNKDFMACINNNILYLTFYTDKCEKEFIWENKIEKYRVYFEQINQTYIDVEAHDVDEAYELATQEYEEGFSAPSICSIECNNKTVYDGD